MPLKLRKCFEHKRVWWNDENFGSKFNGSLWEPQINAGEFFFYHVAEAGHEPHKKFTLVGWGGTEDAFATPIGFTPVWDDTGANAKLFSNKSIVRRSLWQPAAPEGYACLGMLGLGAEWHERNEGITPTADDFPRFRCVKLEYLEIMKPNFLSYEWRWNSAGSAAKKNLSLYNVVFNQPGLNEILTIGLGVAMLETVEIPANQVFSFNPDVVTFDEKYDADETTPQVRLIQILGKAKAVYIGNFWHYHSSTWKYHHFILFSDNRLEYYKDNSDENTSKSKYNALVSLELRGSYDLSFVSSLEIVVNQKRESKYLQTQKAAEKKQDQLTYLTAPSLSPQPGPRSSFKALKSLFGFSKEPTPYVIELQIVNKKPVKFGFENESLMHLWYNQLKLFSIVTTDDRPVPLPGIMKNISRLSRSSGSQLSGYFIKTTPSLEEEFKASNTPEIFSNSPFQKELIFQQSKMPLTRWAKWSFWMTVIESGMKFSVFQCTGVETCWNLYAGKDRDQIRKSELATLLTDWMETRLDAFPGTVSRMEGFDFLDNVGERALQAKRFLDTEQSGRVIFQEFKRIQTLGFWSLMDEKKPMTRLQEARKMWSRILKLLAEYGFLGDDEVFEIWERYDSTETGTLTLSDMQDFLKDWIRAIAKLYPDAVDRKSVQNFLESIESRAVLAMRYLDQTSEGVTFYRFRQIQDSAFWSHIDYMVNIGISDTNLSFSEADSINLSISNSMSARPSPKLSWCSEKTDMSIEILFPPPDGIELSESLDLRDPGAQLTDAEMPEDPALNLKLNNSKLSLY